MLRCSRYLLLIPIFVLTNCQPPTTAGDTAPSAQKAAVVGSVLDEFEDPILGATVSVDGTSSQTTANGTFHLPNIPVGPHALVVSKAGYKSLSTLLVVGKGMDVLQLVLSTEALPSASALRTRLISCDQTSAIFETDLYVINHESEFATGLKIGDFSINSFSGDYGGTFSFNPTYLASTTQASEGPFSAEMLLDQSGSISSTDPLNLRIAASKSFMAACGPGDEVHLSAFASGGDLPYELTIWGDKFTEDGRSYIPTLDALTTMIGGSTPLYSSMSSMIDFISSNANRSNKSLIVFTDGDDTDGGATPEGIISKAVLNGIRIYPVALSENVNHGVLSEVASATNGVVMAASDARSLVSYYKHLGNILHGGVQSYRIRWQANTTKPFFDAGSSFWTWVKVSLSNGHFAYAPIYLKIK